MAHFALLFKVRDYPTWKRVFDEVDHQRRAAGGTDYQIYHVDGDRDDVMLMDGWDSLDNAETFAESEGLREAMGRAGVEGVPTFLFLNDGDSG